MLKKLLSPISEIIKDAKKGKMFILVDDKDRENEGDLVVPATKCNSKSINFMAKHGRGLICLALTKGQVSKLNLPLMSSVNKSRMQTAFTVSIEAKKGITTGISAFDRAKTIKVATKYNVKKNEIVSPGHVFPLVSRNGGVLERAGHTEASVDISRLAKLNPSAVICEVMNEDGRMARLGDLKRFSRKHKLKIATIEDLISFRLKNEKLVQFYSKKIIKKKRVDLEILIYKNKLDNSLQYVVKKGNIKKKAVRVRVISTRHNSEKSLLKDNKINHILKFLDKYSNFVLLIIKDQKSAKQAASELIKGNNVLRYYGIGAQIIKDIGINKMILVSRSKKKIIGLEGFGLKIIKQEIIR